MERGRPVKRGSDRRQLVRTTEEGRLQLFSCPIEIVWEAVEKPVDELLRMVIVSLRVFGRAAYALVGFACDQKKIQLAEISGDSSGGLSIPDNDQDPLSKLPEFMMFEEVASRAQRLTDVTKLALEEAVLAGLWREIRFKIPEAAEVYEYCKQTGALPQYALVEKRRSSAEVPFGECEFYEGKNGTEDTGGTATGGEL